MQNGSSGSRQWFDVEVSEQFAVAADVALSLMACVRK